MPEEPKTADTEDMGDTEDLAAKEYDAERRAEQRKVVGSNAPLPTLDENPEVGLSQKGIGEDAVVKRETEI